MAESQQTTSKRSIWIMDPVRDLVLLVATPAIIFPVALLVLYFATNATFVLLVAAFGQVGHNLPGLIRAYGDRELFRRYRFRFTVAPILLGAVCLIAAVNHLHVLILVTVTWAVWHALMQTYGFLRIYSAKDASSSKLDRRLDWGMCLLWFGGAILLNDQPLLLMTNRWYQCGGFGISPGFLETVQTLWWYALISVTAFWSFRQVVSLRRNAQSVSIKVLLMVTSVGFYWFAYAICESMLVGAAMFEIFHDVQYLTIVWLFNRRRVEQKAEVGRFVSFVFRRSGALVGLYVGLVFAFGGTRLIEGALSAGTAKHLLTTFLATSGLLHFYYDGFIWKIRESDNQRSLGLQPKTPLAINVPAAIHCLKWAAFLLPIVWLTMAEVRFEPDVTTRWILLSRSFPDSQEVQLQTAELLNKQDRLIEAARYYQRVVELDPSLSNVRLKLAAVQHRRGRTVSALSQLAQILQDDAQHEPARLMASRILAEDGQTDQAEAQLRLILETNPDSIDARTNLGVVLSLAGKLDAAISEFREVLKSRNDADAHFNLAHALVQRGESKLAEDHFAEAFRLRPDLVQRKIQRASE
jgi:tetratricopeptide (TPR) repeat protein